MCRSREHRGHRRRWLWVLSALCAIALAGGVAVADQKLVVIGDDTDTSEKGDSVKVTFEGGENAIRIYVQEGGRTQQFEIISRDDSGDWEDDEEAAADRRRPDRWREPMPDADDHVSFGNDVVVSAGQVVPGDVVCIFGSATIRGIVHGDVVTIGGHIHVEPHGAIMGEAAAIGGGDIRVDSGGVIHGEAVTVGGRVRQGHSAVIGKRVEISFIPSFGPSLGFAGIGWLSFLAHLIFVGFAGWILLRLSLSRTGISVATLKSRGWESLLAGVGGGIVYTIVIVPLLLVLAIVLVAIVVGIPLVPVLVLLLLIFPIPGYLVTAALLGLTVMGGPAQVPGPDTEPGAAPAYPTRNLGKSFFLGHLLLSLPGLVGLIMAILGIGSLAARVFMLLSLVVINLAISLGWGAFLLSRFGRRTPSTQPVAAG